jgi:hypothetical protein
VACVGLTEGCTKAEVDALQGHGNAHGARHAAVAFQLLLHGRGQGPVSGGPQLDNRVRVALVGAHQRQSGAVVFCREVQLARHRCLLAGYVMGDSGEAREVAVRAKANEKLLVDKAGISHRHASVDLLLHRTFRDGQIHRGTANEAALAAGNRGAEAGEVVYIDVAGECGLRDPEMRQRSVGRYLKSGKYIV